MQYIYGHVFTCNFSLFGAPLVVSFYSQCPFKLTVFFCPRTHPGAPCSVAHKLAPLLTQHEPERVSDCESGERVSRRGSETIRTRSAPQRIKLPRRFRAEPDASPSTSAFGRRTAVALFPAVRPTQRKLHDRIHFGVARAAHEARNGGINGMFSVLVLRRFCATGSGFVR